MTDKTYKQAYYAKRKADGICVSCPASALPGKVLCGSCTERETRRYTEHKSTGICFSCPAEISPGKTRCSDCAKRDAARHTERKLKGLCASCPAHIPSGKNRCAGCLKRTREIAADLRTEHRLHGLCIRCTAEALPDNQHCLEHYLRATARHHLGSSKRWTELRDLFYAQEEKCRYTRLPLILGVNTEVDHIQPKTKNGTLNDISNLCWALAPINQMKYNFTRLELYEMSRRYVREYEAEQDAAVKEFV